jgi:hypothetical protein
MTDVDREVEGDSELAAPSGAELPAETGRADGDDEDYLDDEGEEAAVRPRAGSRPSNAVLLIGAVLVVVVAQLVMTWFVLAATTQVRDQTTITNGLQKCLLTAQLNENTTTDPSGTAYRAAVRTCISK